MDSYLLLYLPVRFTFVLLDLADRKGSILCILTRQVTKLNVSVTLQSSNYERLRGVSSLGIVAMPLLFFSRGSTLPTTCMLYDVLKYVVVLKYTV